MSVHRFRRFSQISDLAGAGFLESRGGGIPTFSLFCADMLFPGASLFLEHEENT